MKTPPIPEGTSGDTPGSVASNATTAARFSGYQREAIHFLATGKRTAWDGVSALGTPNLRTVVSILGAKGVRIHREPFSFVNRRGTKIHARRYWIDAAERVRVLGGES